MRDEIGTYKTFQKHKYVQMATVHRVKYIWIEVGNDSIDVRNIKANRFISGTRNRRLDVKREKGNVWKLKNKWNARCNGDFWGLDPKIHGEH